MKIRLLLNFFVIFFVGCATLNNGSVSASPKKTVESCLEKIKKGEISASYNYFSKSLKKEVPLDDHIANFESIRDHMGKLLTFSDKHPIFKNYFLDENMFDKKKNASEYKYILSYEKGNLIAYIDLVQEEASYKISVFYLDKI